MDVAAELKEARERAGLTPEQMCERTKMHLPQVEAIEEGAFERLPPGIYADGMIRAYAHEVGVDPEPLVERVHAYLWNLENGPIALDADDTDAFLSEADGLAAEPVRPALVVPGPSPQSNRRESLLEHSWGDDEVAAAPDGRQGGVASQAESLTVYGPLPKKRRPRANRSLALPIALTASLLGAIALGAYLYSGITEYNAPSASPAVGRSAAVTTSEVEVAPASPSASASPAQPGRGASSAQPVPAASVVSPPRPAAATAVDRERRSPKSRVTGAMPAPAKARSARSSEPAAPLVVQGDLNARAAWRTVPLPRRDTRAASRPAASSDPKRVAASDLSGQWTLATRVDSTRLAAYRGLTLAYRLQLQQQGDRVRGTGVKVRENGRAVRGKANTPIAVEGKVDGERLTLAFTERGTRRASAGTFVLTRAANDILRGRFSSDAARSAGTVEARRLE